MGVNCSNCAGTCQKGDKNEINAEISNHLVSDEHQKRAIKSQPNSPKSLKSQDSLLDSLLQSDPRQKQKFHEWAQNEEDSKAKEVNQSKATITVSVPKLKTTKDGALIIQRYWRGFQGRKSLHGRAFKKKDSQSVKSPTISLKGPGGKEANYFKQKDSELLAQDDTIVTDQREKKALFTFKSGATFAGEWLNQKRDGYGIQIWPDGAKYQGYWSNNRACGQGLFFHVDGDKYTGAWKEDKANGFGVYEQISGARYEGEWKNDYQNGIGKEIWIDQSWYEGEYFEGKKEGKGKYVWPDTSFYEGGWKDNKINGFGVYSWIDGRSFKGHWRNNNMHGFGLYKWKDGRTYEGEYLNDKKHGYGKYIWSDGRYYEGQWADGKQDGKGKYVLENGNERIGIWENGKRLKWVEMTDHQKPLDSKNQQKIQDN